MIPQYNCGLDPEYLVTDRDSGFIIPAAVFLPTGDKKASVAYDNAAVELRPLPSTDIGRLLRNTHPLIAQAELERVKSGIKALPNLSPAGMIDLPYRNEPSISSFGCSPSWVLDRSGQLVKSVPLVGPDSPYRTAGFHVHVDTGLKWDSENDALEYNAPFVATIDALVGLVDVIVCNKMHWRLASRLRRTRIGYGLAGEFRLRSGYSIFEYRTMSPWPLGSYKWSEWVTIAIRSIMQAPREAVVRFSSETPRSAVVDSINNCEMTARAIWLQALARWSNIVYTNDVKSRAVVVLSDTLAVPQLAGAQWNEVVQ